MIERIELQNVKGLTAEYRLGPVTVITGSGNAVGKTAILDAITIALVGYHPKLGMKPGATFQLSSGDEMSVVIKRGEAKINARWKRKKNGTVSMDRSGPDTISPNLLDLTEFHMLPAKECQAYVFGLAGGVKIKANEIVDSVRSIPAETELLRLGWFTEAMEAHKAFVESNDQPPQMLLDGAIATIGEALKPSKKHALDMEAAVERLRTMNVEPPKPDESELREMESKLALAEHQNKTLKEETEKWMQAKRDVVMTEGELASIEKRIKTLGGGTREELESKKKRLEDELATLSQRVPVEIPLDTLVDSIATARNCEHNRHRLLQQIEGLKRERDETMTQECCPTCASRGNEWRDSYQTKMFTHISNLQEEACALEVKIKSVESFIAKEKVEVEESALECADWRIKTDGIRTGISALDSRLNYYIRREMLAEKLDVQRKLESSFKPPEKIDVEPIRARLSELKRVRDSYSAWQRNKTELEAVTKEKEKADSDVDWLRAALLNLTTLRQSVVTETMRKITRRALELLDGLVDLTLEFRDGDFGYIDGATGTWVSYETMSGSEQRIVAMGIQYAFAAESEVKILMLDETGVLDPQRMEMLLERVKRLIDAGKIEQFICVSMDVEGLGADVTVINVDGGAK